MVASGLSLIGLHVHLVWEGAPSASRHAEYIAVRMGNPVISHVI